MKKRIKIFSFWTGLALAGFLFFYFLPRSSENFFGAMPRISTPTISDAAPDEAAGIRPVLKTEISQGPDGNSERQSGLYYGALLPLETKTPAELKAKYQNRNFKILIVAGHDNRDYGTNFGKIREADLTLQLSRALANEFLKDDHFKIYLVRDLNTGDYNSELSSYFNNQSEAINSFRAEVWQKIIGLLRTGQFQLKSGVGHTAANERVVQKLFGINKWANENNIDLVLHIHFNDYGGRSSGHAGDYSGFTIYIPEKQYSNYRSSSEIARSVFDFLRKNSAVSDLKGENAGITEDQKLIAVGAYGSLDSAALLIEYGYIYEPQFVNKNVRGAEFGELAYKTYAGVKKYFEPETQLKETMLLPHFWQNPLRRGVQRNLDILSLQEALKLEGVYPPEGSALSDCPLSGLFGFCTEKAVASFQKKYKDEIFRPQNNFAALGLIGPRTLKKLNQLYGN